MAKTKKKLTPSGCVHIKTEEQCKLPCKPVRSRKGRDFLYCKTAISIKKLKNILKKKKLSKKKRRKTLNDIKKLEKLDSEIKETKKKVEKTEKKKDGVMDTIGKALGIISSESDAKEPKVEPKPEPEPVQESEPEQESEPV